MSATTRQERERIVLELYHNQRKTISDIAKEARMSFRRALYGYVSRGG
jgi:DNA-directed RNA polymerase specialized sigma subunit